MNRTFSTMRNDGSPVFRTLLLTLAAGAAGALLNLMHVSMGADLQLVLGNFVYIAVAARVRNPYPVLAALIAVTPLCLTWGHGWPLLIFGAEALVVATLRRRGMNVLYGDVLFWLLLGMPLTAVVMRLQEGGGAELVLFTCLKQIINGALYSSFAALLVKILPLRLGLSHHLQPEKPTNFRNHIVRAVTNIVVFSLAASSVLITRELIEYQQALIHKSLGETAMHLARRTDDYLAHHRSHIALLGATLSQMGNTKDTLQSLLESSHQRMPGFLTMLITDESGLISAASPASRLLATAQPLSVADRAYFRVPMRNHALYVSDVFKGRGFGEDPIIAISAPWYRQDDGPRPAGIVEGSLNLNLFAMVSEVQIDDNAVKVVLLDQQSRIIYASEQLDLSTLVSFANYEPESSAADASGVRTMTLASGEGRFLHTSTPLGNGWRIITLLEYGSIARGVESQYRAVFLILIVTIALAALFSERLGARITTPITGIASALQKNGPLRRVELQPLDESAPLELAVMHTALRDSMELIARHHDELEQTVQLRTRELMTAKDDAERANRAKSEFLSSMSHELRTPMNAILGFSQLMEIDEELSQEQHENVQEILKAGRHLLELINEVLDLARVESGTIRLSLEPVDLAPVLEECLGFVQSSADRRGISVVNQVEQDYRLQADRTRLKQILLNLLSNAIKYNREKGSVSISASTESSGLCISVTDTGHGIPADRMNELFQPFSRLAAEGSGVEGTGIGLSITRRLIEMMHGSISVNSAPGMGSCFSVTLPLSSAAEPTEAGTDNPRPVDGARQVFDPATRACRFKVLYIEDNPSNLLLVTRAFDRLPDIELISAHNAEFGIELAFSQSPDLVLLDMNLPGMLGSDVLQVLRSDSRLNHVHVIAVTANAMPSDVSRGLSNGFSDYLTKPIDVNHLIATVKHHLAAAPD
jgi:signal transduction histidine kinase/ActR/RegA family two-component response regulator